MSPAEMETLCNAANTPDARDYIASQLTVEEAFQLVVYLNLRLQNKGVYRKDH